MAKAKITISMEEEFVADLMRIAVQRHVSRSRLIEEAFKVWKKEQIKAALKDGYENMAKEDRSTAERNIRIAREVLRER